MTQDEAREQLRRLVAADTFPTLDGFDLRDLLRNARRPDYRGVMDVDVPDPTGLPRTIEDGAYPVWEKSHAYTLDEAVVPITRTGCLYLVTVAGTSGAEEPAWPLSGTITDGGVTWEQVINALVWMPTYDLFAAAAEGWRWKAGKVSDRITFGSQGDSYNAEQIHLHCLEMAKYYDSKAAPTSIPVVSARTRPFLELPRAN